MYVEYNTRGGVEWQIQPKTKLSAIFDTTSPPRVLRVNSILTDLLLCVEGSAVALVMDPEHDAYKQIEAIVSDSLLP